MAASLVLSCAQPCQCILSQPVANRRTTSTNVHTELTMGTILRCSQCIIFYLFSSSRYQSRPKVSHKCSEKHMFDNQNRALATVSYTFCWHWGPRPPQHKPYFFVKKQRVSRARVSSPVNSHAPGLYHFPTTWYWGWHDDVVDMMVWMLAMTIVNNLEVC